MPHRKQSFINIGLSVRTFVRLVFYEDESCFGLSIIKPADHVVLSRFFSPTFHCKTSSRFIEWNMHDEVIQFFIFCFSLSTIINTQKKRKNRSYHASLRRLLLFTSIDRDVYCQWITNKRQNKKRTKDLREDWKFNLDHFNRNQNRKISDDCHYYSLDDWRFFISSSSSPPSIGIGSFRAFLDLKYKCHNWMTCTTINVHKHRITNQA